GEAHFVVFLERQCGFSRGAHDEVAQLDGGEGRERQRATQNQRRGMTAPVQTQAELPGAADLDGRHIVRTWQEADTGGAASLLEQLPQQLAAELREVTAVAYRDVAALRCSPRSRGRGVKAQPLHHFTGAIEQLDAHPLWTCAPELPGKCTLALG